MLLDGINLTLAFVNQGDQRLCCGVVSACQVVAQGDVALGGSLVEDVSFVLPGLASANDFRQFVGGCFRCRALGFAQAGNGIPHTRQRGLLLGSPVAHAEVKRLDGGEVERGKLGDDRFVDHTVCIRHLPTQFSPPFAPDCMCGCGEQRFWRLVMRRGGGAVFDRLRIPPCLRQRFDLFIDIFKTVFCYGGGFAQRIEVSHCVADCYLRGGYRVIDPCDCVFRRLDAATGGVE